MIHSSRHSDMAVRALLRGASKFWPRMSPTMLLSGLMAIVTIAPAAASGYPTVSEIKNILTNGPKTYYRALNRVDAGESNAQYGSAHEIVIKMTRTQSVIEELKGPGPSEEDLIIRDH